MTIISPIDDRTSAEQVIVKFLHNSGIGGLASVEDLGKVAWYQSDQQSTERLDPA